MVTFGSLKDNLGLTIRPGKGGETLLRGTQMLFICVSIPEIATRLPGPHFVFHSRQGMISNHHSTSPRSVCWLSICSGFGKQHHPFSLPCKLRLAYGPGGSICQPKVGSVETPGLGSSPRLLPSSPTGVLSQPSRLQSLRPVCTPLSQRWLGGRTVQ